jgi:hypothetical protein
VPEILDRDLPRPDDVCLCWLSFLLTAMMAAGQEEDREEEKDAAPHSLFCERISAETGTRDKRRQRRDRRQRRERKLHAAQRLLPIPFTFHHWFSTNRGSVQFAGSEARNWSGDIPVARRNAHAKALGLFAFHHLKGPEQAIQEMFRVVRHGGKVVVINAVPAAAKRDRFDAFEKLRDPSHASALTIEELVELGERHALRPVRVRRLRLRIELESHLTQSLSTPVVVDQLRELVQADAESNLMDFRPERANGRWYIHYQLTVFAWEAGEPP